MARAIADLSVDLIALRRVGTLRCRLDDHALARQQHSPGAAIRWKSLTKRLICFATTRRTCHQLFVLASQRVSRTNNQHPILGIHFEHLAHCSQLRCKNSSSKTHVLMPGASIHVRESKTVTGCNEYYS